MTRISAVYKIVNTTTGDCYVGSSMDVHRRWKEHRCLYHQNEHPNSQMYKDMQELGVDKFELQIVCLAEPKLLKQVEQEFIDMIHPTYNSARAFGFDVERRKKYERERDKKRRPLKNQYTKNWQERACIYNGKHITFNALYLRFRSMGAENPANEAKKYLIQ